MNRKKLWTLSLGVITLLLLALPQIQLRPAHASQDLTPDAAQTKLRIGNYDIREDESKRTRVVGERKALSLKAAQTNTKAIFESRMAAAKSRLSSQVPGLEVQMSSAGSAEIVTVEPGRRRFLTEPSSRQHETIVRRFVRGNADLYGMTATQAAQLEKIADYTNPAGNLAWVELQQKINGIPVFQGELRAALTAQGEIVRTVGRLVPVEETSGGVFGEQLMAADAASSAAEAVSRAAATIGISLNAGDLVTKTSDGGAVIFEQGPFTEEIKVEPVYFPIEAGMVTRSWSMVLWQDTPAYYTIIDANTGDLLWRKNITNEQTQTATFSAYDADSPAPLSPTSVTGPGTGFQATGINRTSFTLISELPAFDNLGWITDGGNVTTGNNVDAGLDIVAPNGIDPTGRATGSPFRVFDFPYTPSPLGTDAPSDANYRMGAVTNLFFWANRYHDRLYQLGFTEAARNFQQNNFGRGGLGNDFVRAEAQDLSGTNNANFSTPPDGSLPRCQMFIWPGPTPDRDGDLDQEVSLHEMTHGTSNRLHNNASGLAALLSGGMGEGWSDFYALSLLSQAGDDVDGIFAFGAYVTNLVSPGLTDNYYYGIRRFPYAVKTNVGPNGKPHNPLTLGDIDPSRVDLTDGAFARGPFGSGGRWGATEVHNIGEIWTMSLLEARARVIHRLGWAVGNQRMLQIVTDGMKLDPVNPTMQQARDSLLLADAASFSGDDQKDIWAGFAARGIGFGSSITSLANFSVKESFDTPIPGMGAVAVADLACNSNGKPDVGEDVTLTIPLTNPLAATLTGVTASVVGGGTANYGTIASGATSTQNISYKLPTNVTCGDPVTVSVVVTSNLGTETKTFTIRTGTPVTTYSENFDGVTAPALPAGWTTSQTGSESLWVTSTTAADSGPNAASTGFPSTTGANDLISPSIAITSANSQLTFRHSYISEIPWDGGVLEISIPTLNGGAFTEILDAGGSFNSGAYAIALNRTADGNTNALQARAAWTGNSGGFITTVVNLPASANGQNIRLRFRAGADSSTTVANNHWRIDSIVINSFQCATTPTTTAANSPSAQFSDPVTLSATVGAACTTPTGSVQFLVDGNPVGSAPVTGAGIVSITIPAAFIPGPHTVTANYTSTNPFYQNSSGIGTLTVGKEDAVVTPAAGNPVLIKVSGGGGASGSFTLGAAIADSSDGSPGDTSAATPVSFTLSPLGAGASYNASAPSGTGGGVGTTLNVTASFTGVAVNVYDVVVAAGGSYTGSCHTLVTVYDPSLGNTSGGGSLIHNAFLANFGFVARLVSGHAQGSFIYSEHRPAGDVTLRSVSLTSLTIVGNTATIQGTATVNDAPGYTFKLIVTDSSELGATDQVALEVTGPGGISVPDLKFAKTTISSGNLVVPH